MDVCRLLIRGCAQLANRLDAQGWQHESADRGADQAPEDLSQWMARADPCLAKSEDERHRNPRHASGEVADRVKGCVIGPVDILDHYDRGMGCQDLKHGRQGLIESLGRQGRCECRIVVGHVTERAEAAWCEQIVAPTRHGRDIDAQPVAERADECRLARARLAGDQHDDPVTALDGGPHCRDQLLELRFTFEELGSSWGEAVDRHRLGAEETVAERLCLRRWRDAELRFERTLHAGITPEPFRAVPAQNRLPQCLEMRLLVRRVEPHELLPPVRTTHQCCDEQPYSLAWLFQPWLAEVVGKQRAGKLE